MTGGRSGAPRIGENKEKGKKGELIASYELLRKIFPDDKGSGRGRKKRGKEDMPARVTLPDGVVSIRLLLLDNLRESPS